MNYIEKWFTKKNTCYASIAIGACMLLTILLSFTVDVNSKSMGFSVTVFCLLYYVYFLAYLILCSAYAYLYFKKQEKATILLIGLIISAIMIIVCFLNWKIIHALWSMANGDFYGVMGLLSILDSLELRLHLLRIMMFVSVGFAGYQMYLLRVSKDIPITPEQQAAMKENLDKAKEQAIKGAGIANDQVKKISQRIKDFLKTKNGKLITGGIALCIVCVGVFAFYLANKKVSINLTQTCDYQLQGDSGTGSITRISCENDYTGNDQMIQLFLSTLSYKVENNGSLKNGDVVFITANYSEDDLDKLKIDISNNSHEVEVQGLVENYKKASELPSQLLELATAKAKEAAIEESEDTYFPYNSALYRAKNVQAEEPQLLSAYMLEDTYTSELIYLYKTKVSGTVKEEAVSATMYYKITVHSPSSTWLQENASIRTSSTTIFKEYSNDIPSDEEAIELLKKGIYSGTLVEVPNTQTTFSKDAM